jgi:L1 cell adhesion molecule like protein
MVLSVFVPVLEKEVTIEELCSHFFRNIHNQVKQYVGKIVRDCIISLPSGVEETIRQRIVESARVGGIRIKAFIDDAVATLLAYGLDDPVSNSRSLSLVVDIGWSKCEVSVWTISDGILSLVPSSTLILPDISAKAFISVLTDFCVQDFVRKTRNSGVTANVITENKRVMKRLNRECEAAVRSLSTNAEVTIDIDSLYEGMDFSLRISRARLEDLNLSIYTNLRNSITNTLNNLDIYPQQIKTICLSGGLVAVPKFLSILKGIFPESDFLKCPTDPSETQCIGAALQGKYLIERVMLIL